MVRENGTQNGNGHKKPKRGLHPVMAKIVVDAAISKHRPQAIFADAVCSPSSPSVIKPVNKAQVSNLMKRVRASFLQQQVTNILQLETFVALKKHLIS